MNNSLRVKFQFNKAIDRYIEIPDLHHAPRLYDMVQIPDFLQGTDVTAEELAKIEEHAVWTVWYTNWNRDENGVFLEVCFNGQ